MCVVCIEEFLFFRAAFVSCDVVLRKRIGKVGTYVVVSCTKDSNTKFCVYPLQFRSNMIISFKWIGTSMMGASTHASVNCIGKDVAKIHVVVFMGFLILL